MFGSLAVEYMTALEHAGDALRSLASRSEGFVRLQHESDAEQIEHLLRAVRSTIESEA